MRIAYRVETVTPIERRPGDTADTPRFIVTVATDNGWLIPVRLTDAQLADRATAEAMISAAVQATAKAASLATGQALNPEKE